MNVQFKYQWQSLLWFITCSRGPKLFFGKKTRLLQYVPVNTLEWHIRASFLMPSGTKCTNWVSVVPTGHYVLYPSSPAVCGVDSWGDTRIEMNSCMLWYVYVMTRSSLNTHIVIAFQAVYLYTQEWVLWWTLIWIAILKLTFMWTLRKKRKVICALKKRISERWNGRL